MPEVDDVRFRTIRLEDSRTEYGDKAVVGVDTAKRVFQLHWMEPDGELADLKLSRKKFAGHFADRAPCRIGLEACGGPQAATRATGGMRGRDLHGVAGLAAERVGHDHGDVVSGAAGVHGVELVPGAGGDGARGAGPGSRRRDGDADARSGERGGLRGRGGGGADGGDRRGGGVGVHGGAGDPSVRFGDGDGDGGSEFCAEFEQACRERQIPLIVLPPYSLKLNSRVEYVHGTCRREFYECTEMAADLEGARRQWAGWEDTYNRVRPHESLGLKTPVQYISSRSSSRACSHMS